MDDPINTDDPISSIPNFVDKIRAEIKHASGIIIQLSAKQEDLSHALDTVTEEKRKWRLKLLKLEATIQKELTRQEQPNG